MSDERPRSANRPAPWYEDGLRFECQPDCGRCCTNHGAYAYVYLDGDDLPRLAEFFDITPEEFTERYTTLDDGFVVLLADRPQCPFLDGSLCTVYDARPTQCRTFPFWGEHLGSRTAWKRVAEFCPGIDRGRRHPPTVIRRRINERDT